MKITLSKKQWLEVGKQTGWLKKAQIEQKQDPKSPANIEMAQQNKEKLDKFNIAHEFLPYWDTNYMIPGQIIDIHVNKFGKYLLTNGGVEVKDEGLEDFISDERQAHKVWERKDFDPIDTFCSDCGEKDPKVDNVDFGIGAYEFQGAPGVDKQVQPATKCCNSGIEDKYGRKKDAEVNVPTKEDYMEDLREDMRKENEI